MHQRIGIGQAPAGSVTTGTPRSGTRWVKGNESPQKNPAGIGSRAKSTWVALATVRQMSTPLGMTSPAMIGDARRAQANTTNSCFFNTMEMLLGSDIKSTHQRQRSNPATRWPRDLSSETRDPTSIGKTRRHRCDNSCDTRGAAAS
ncbi:MAG: hypothetical protein HC897_01190 [Thermoanaerobaculia bacterium]|nr:hypothetical protein [Thermoanaerobaculia bacterium]